MLKPPLLKLTHSICYYFWASYCCVIQFALNCRKRAFNPCDISSIIWLTPIDGNINDKTFFTSKHSMLWKLRIHWFVLNWRCSADLWRLTEIRERRKIMNDWGYYTIQVSLQLQYALPSPLSTTHMLGAFYFAATACVMRKVLLAPILCSVYYQFLLWHHPW